MGPRIINNPDRFLKNFGSSLRPLRLAVPVSLGRPSLPRCHGSFRLSSPLLQVHLVIGTPYLSSKLSFSLSSLSLGTPLPPADLFTVPLLKSESTLQVGEPLRVISDRYDDIQLEVHVIEATCNP